MKKICKECKINKEVSEYYKHAQGKTGVISRCKECIKKGRRSQRERELARQWERLKRKRPDSYQTKRAKMYRDKNPLKYKAQTKVGNYYRYGREKERPNKCIKCGSSEHIHLHHEDYNKPGEIIPLCAYCHSKIHQGKFKALKEWIIKLPF